MEDFEKNTDPAQTHIVRTNQGKWETSSHCFQCALNTVHECHDFGEDIHTFPGIERKWLSASVSEKVHYPRVRYLVSYPPHTPQLPYHDHPGGEEYLVFSGSFCDTNFPDVKAPAFVRYPIGTHHAAMTEPSHERTDILCWWGLMQTTSSTESGRSVQLDPQTLTPSGVAPEAVQLIDGFVEDIAAVKGVILQGLFPTSIGCEAGTAEKRALCKSYLRKSTRDTPWDFQVPMAVFRTVSTTLALMTKTAFLQHQLGSRSFNAKDQIGFPAWSGALADLR